jgi:enterobactin synthetase component D
LTAVYDRSANTASADAREAIAWPPDAERWVPGRRAEFLAGRLLARIALMRLGIGPQAARNIAVDPMRAPVWPGGICGAISHDGDRVACLVARSRDMIAGVDIAALDLNNDERDAIWSIALTAQDRARIETLPRDERGPAAIRVFSAKETLFKALYPLVRDFLGFEAAEIVGIDRHDHVVLRLTRDLTRSIPAGSGFGIVCRAMPAHVLTWLLQPGPPFQITVSPRHRQGP